MLRAAPGWCEFLLDGVEHRERGHLQAGSQHQSVGTAGIDAPGRRQELCGVESDDGEVVRDLGTDRVDDLEVSGCHRSETGWRHSRSGSGGKLSFTASDQHPGRGLGITLIPYIWGSAVGLQAALHVMAALPRVPHTWQQPPLWMEYEQTQNPFRDDLVAEPVVRRDGMVRIPDAPGLGITIDDAVIERYRVG